MKKILFLVVMFLGMLSCIDDKSSMVYPSQNPDFSFIDISSSLKWLTVDWGEEFVFTPTVKQTIESQNLTYIWKANKISEKDGVLGVQFECGNSPTLKYVFPEIGQFRITLEVKNESYIEQRSWTLDVQVNNEGLYVVGRAENGMSNMAFARKLSEKDEEEGKSLTFVPDMLGNVNPEIEFKDVVKIIRSESSWNESSDPYLFIYCKNRIYAADPITFQVLLTTEVPNGDEIADVQTIDETAEDVRLFMKSGKYMLYNKSLFNFNVNKIDSEKVYDKTYNNFFSSYASAFIGVDYSLPKVYVIDNNLQTLISNTTGITGLYPTVAVEDYFENVYKGRDVICAGLMNGWQGAYYFVSLGKNDPKDVSIVEANVGYGTGANAKIYGLIQKRNTKYKASSGITLPKEAQLVANARYSSMYYAVGDEIYVWYPKAIEPQNYLPETAAIILDGKKEVTTMAISYDMKELYVGFYDPSREGEMKGGLYIYNAADIGVKANLQPSRKFEGISYRPVQVGYKTYMQGTYEDE